MTIAIAVGHYLQSQQHPCLAVETLREITDGVRHIVTIAAARRFEQYINDGPPGKSSGFARSQNNQYQGGDDDLEL